MKKLLSILCVVLTICVVSTTAVFAESVPDAAEDPVTVVDVADTAAKIVSGSYTLTDDGAPVLEVIHVKEPGASAELSDITLNGFYMAEFMLPETNYNVFLTGLTQDNVEEIRQAIVDSYTAGADFELKNLGFIDAEKTDPEDGDENLCWAASASNILTYTGWAAKAGFNSTDDLFEAFIDAFNDKGGNVENATGWFINGVSSSGGAQPAEGTGNYLPQYNYNDLVETFEIKENCAGYFKLFYDRLRKGYGVSLSAGIYGSEGYEGAHAITCWGFVTDIRFSATNKQHYKSVFITDSDSDQYSVKEGDDRRDADDVMSLCALESVEQEGISTYQFNISNQQIALLTDGATVLPYSEDVPYETSEDAKMDLRTAPDIAFDPFVLTDDPQDDEHTITVFAADATVYYQPYMMNISNAAYEGKLALSVYVTDSQGDTVYSKEFKYSKTVSIEPSYGMAFNAESLPSLPVGDYTITASFNPTHTPAEAYYYNNIRSISFKIRNTYLIGDVDNDDDVSIVDATMIQRILARIGENNIENAVQRGDINESGDLDAVDVTLIQRSLSGLKIDYPIKESRFLD